MQRLIATSLAGLLFAGQLAAPAVSVAENYGSTATPIKHVVVIFGENISFDHYFGTYPHALNPPQEPSFRPARNTPSVNGYTDGLLFENPNFLNTVGNGAGASNPFRLDRSQAATNDQDHNYTAEQSAFDHGLMDSFPEFTGHGGVSGSLTMGYFDGNTVTALWNYAQRYAMNDNAYGTTFGPSTPGALNLISGQTNGVIQEMNASYAIVDGGNSTSTLINDVDPFGDVCSNPSTQIQMGGTNIGDLLNSRGITWGWFEGGFDLSKKNPDGTTGCSRDHYSQYTKGKVGDYIPHHEPFQYYTTTSNLKHLRPSSVRMIGIDGDQANHQYDIDDFYASVNTGNMPAVSFLKAPGYEDAHGGYSDPLDEQNFLVHVINFLQSRPEWDSTAVILNYDDSDGWYDHQLGQIMNQSATSADTLTDPGHCGTGDAALAGPNVLHAQGRCGYGPRIPIMVISRYAKRNFVDHTLTDQTSIIHFIEDNWLGGQRIGSGSYDAISGPLNNMFDFHSDSDDNRLLLQEQTGLPSQGSLNP